MSSSTAERFTTVANRLLRWPARRTRRPSGPVAAVPVATATPVRVAAPGAPSAAWRPRVSSGCGR